MKYKALSVKQPWANLICLGHKTIETRKWRTNYRGPLLICASKSPVSANEFSRQLIWVHGRIGREQVMGLPRGIALCLVDLVGCEPMTNFHEAAACCRTYQGAWAWRLANPRKLKRPWYEVKGSLGLFNVELDRVVLL